MNKTYLLAIAATLVAAPMAFAHTDGGVYGTPKTYCENLKGDTSVHDYAVNGLTGVAYLLGFFIDGNLNDCDGDGTPGDYDGHSEYATGGAWLLASDAGAPISGASACFGEAPHHPTFPNVWVFDHVWPSGVLFVVGIDTTNFPQPAPTPDDPNAVLDCGDNVDDIDSGYCQDHCGVTFAPGVDGAYHVFVVNDLGGFDDEGEICSPALIHGPEDPNDEVVCVVIDPHSATSGHVYT